MRSTATAVGLCRARAVGCSVVIGVAVTQVESTAGAAAGDADADDDSKRRFLAGTAADGLVLLLSRAELWANGLVGEAAAGAV